MIKIKSRVLRSVLSAVLILAMLMSTGSVVFLASAAGELQALVDAAQGTLKLEQDYTEAITVAAGKTLTLDLNGHKIDVVGANAIVNDGTLTITDSVGTGVIYASAPGSAVSTVKNNGTLTIAGGTISAYGWYSGDVIAVKNSGTATIIGGTLEAESHRNITAIALDNDGTVTEISGGEFIANNYMERNGSFQYAFGIRNNGSGVIKLISNAWVYGAHGEDVNGNNCLGINNNGGKIEMISGGIFIGHVGSSGHAAGLRNSSATTTATLGGGVFYGLRKCANANNPWQISSSQPESSYADGYAKSIVDGLGYVLKEGQQTVVLMDGIVPAAAYLIENGAVVAKYGKVSADYSVTLNGAALTDAQIVALAGENTNTVITDGVAEYNIAKTTDLANRFLVSVPNVATPEDLVAMDALKAEYDKMDVTDKAAVDANLGQSTFEALYNKITDQVRDGKAVVIDFEDGTATDAISGITADLGANVAVADGVATFSNSSKGYANIVKWASDDYDPFYYAVDGSAISMKVRMDDLATKAVLFGYGYYGYRFILEVDGDKLLVSTRYEDDNTSEFSVTGLNAYQGQWIDLLITCENGKNVYTVYINGQRIGSGALNYSLYDLAVLAETSPRKNQNAAYTGYYTVGNASYWTTDNNIGNNIHNTFVGAVDEVVLYADVVTKLDVEAMYDPTITDLRRVDNAEEVWAISGPGTGGENYEKPFDGDTTTKFGNNSHTTPFVWRVDNPVTAKYYSIYSGTDSASWKGRAPKTWTLYGCTEEEYAAESINWHVVDARTNDQTILDTNSEEFLFKIPAENVGQYQYYKIEFANHAGVWLQFSELCLYVVDEPVPYPYSDYELLDLDFTMGYWNSGNGGYAAAPTINSAADNAKYFIASQRLTADDIPAGSIIQVDYGYQYRPEGWVAEGETGPGRPGNVTTTETVVDDTFWSKFEYRAFNITSTTANTDISGMVNTAASHFRVYVPIFADYTAVDAAIEQIPADLSGYTAASVEALNNAVAAVDYTKTVSFQSDVDAYADAILDAIEGLAPAISIEIDISEGVVVESDTAGKYNITWNANILLEDSIENVNADIVTMGYGVIYGTSADEVNKLANGEATELAAKKAFAEGEDVDVYTIFGFRLKNVVEGRNRAAKFYVSYQYNGKLYTVYSDCVSANASAPQ